MDPIDDLKKCLALYRELLDLTAEQEACLRSARYDRLIEILTRKETLVGAAAQCWGRVQGSPPEARQAPGFAAALQELRSVTERLVAAEARCQELVPARPLPKAPPGRALAAYGKKY